MKTFCLAAAIVVALVAGTPTSLPGQKVGKHPPPKPKDTPQPAPLPLSVAPEQTDTGPIYTYDQKGPPAAPPLVSPQQAKTIMDKFRASYESMGKPRFLIYVNRELVDDKSGLKLVGRNEKSETTITQPGAKDRGAAAKEVQRSTSENRYRNDEAPERLLADRQTVRDVERLFGRPLRLAGANLADQRLATQLIPDHPFEPQQTEGEQSRKDRQALGQIADVVIEVLISSKEIQVNNFDAVTTYTMPDIQATAIRLKDARIIGQAATADLYGGEPTPALARSSNVHSITEATALALMEDMTAGSPPPPVEDHP